MLKDKYNLNRFITQLPREVSIDDLIKVLVKAGISRDTFYRDRAIRSNSRQSISADRLAIYSQILNCELAELMPKVKKIKPLIKRS